MSSKIGVGAVVETAAIANGIILIKGTAENQVKISGANGAAVGIASVSQPSTATPVGEEISQIFGGVTHVLLAATLTRGDFFESDAAGKAVAVGAVADSQRNVVGQLIESGVSGELIECHVNIGFKKIAV